MTADELNDLFSRIDALESRLVGDASAGEHRTSVARLQQILDQAGQQFFAESASKRDGRGKRLELSRGVRDRLRSERNADEQDRPLNARNAAILQLVEAMFRYLGRSGALDPIACEALQGMQVPLAKVALDNPAALQDEGLPVRQLLEFLILACKGYDRHAGSRALSILEGAVQCTRQVLEAQGPTNEGCRAAKRSFAAFLQQYNRESLIFEKNLVAKEEGQSVRDNARRTVNRELLGAVAGKRLPRDFLRFLEEVWKKYLFVTYLRQGVDSDTWKDAIEAIRIVAESLVTRDASGMFDYYHSGQIRALGLLRSGAESIYQNSALTQKVLERIDAIHMAVMSDEEPDLGDTATVSADDAGDEDDATHATGREEQALVEPLRVGDWVILNDRGVEQRTKLIEKHAGRRYCLFANCSGIRVARLDFSRLAEMLRSGAAKTLDTSETYDQALSFAYAQVAEYIPRFETKVNEAVQERERVLQERRKAAAEQETRRRPGEEELQAVEQTREQAWQEAREHDRREAETLEEARRNERELLAQHAMEDVSKMQPGGWLELITTDGEKVTCKLGLKLKSSGKMIFVDQTGKKAAELLPAELAARIAEGNARILDLGTAFGETLQHAPDEHREKTDVD